MNLDFVEETTTSIAGTSGDGAITLTALQTTAPGTLRFSNILGTSTARLVHYVIEDITATAGKFEKGIGSVSNNVLTRTSPRETWDGTTYAASGASALQFGASPTSGDIRIRCAPMASALLPSTPFYVSSLGDDMGLLAPNMPGSGTPSPTVKFATGTQYFYPYYWMGDGPIAQAAMVAGSTASAGAHLQFALYEVGSDGLPGRALLIFNAMSLATANVTVKDSTTGTWSGDLASLLWLPPGWYWLSWMADSATPSVLCANLKNSLGWNVAGPMPPMNRATSGYIGSNVLTDASATYGTWPNPRTATLSLQIAPSAGNVPIFGLKPGN